MVIHTGGFSTSTGDDEGLAYVYCVDDSGYCLSLARNLEDELVEVMVVDQVNHKTREAAVELWRDKLRVLLSRTATAELDGITEYVVPLEFSAEELRDLHAALTVIFSGGGRYDKRF